MHIIKFAIHTISVCVCMSIAYKICDTAHLMKVVSSFLFEVDEESPALQARSPGALT